MAHGDRAFNFSLRQHYLRQVQRVLSQSPCDTPKASIQI
jgi:hypothetical protein